MTERTPEEIGLRAALQAHRAAEQVRLCRLEAANTPRPEAAHLMAGIAHRWAAKAQRAASRFEDVADSATPELDEDTESASSDALAATEYAIRWYTTPDLEYVSRDVLAPETREGCARAHAKAAQAHRAAAHILAHARP